MLKQKEINISDSNIGNLGSDVEKSARSEAAHSEKAWEGCGQTPGLEIWRIEKFQVVPLPREQYGEFYSGDSYIVLYTYKKNPNAPKLSWNIHFWLGKSTTQDEAGTAAYKTVELDDYLGTEPVEYREMQGFESDTFLQYFHNEIRILEGGVESGFKHVEPEKYVPRLLHLKGKKKVRVTQVPIALDSMNSGDVFVLDAGLRVFQFNGKRSSPGERVKGAQLCRALSEERKGLARVAVIEEDEKSDAAQTFWGTLGFEGPIKSAELGGSDLEADRCDERRLFHLSDASGKMVFRELASGPACKPSLLHSDDVFILDSGAEVFAWIGKRASPNEKRNALAYAQDYLKNYNRPSYLPICRVLEGGENETFLAAFS